MGVEEVRDVELKESPWFAEIAEALGLTTFQIVGAMAIPKFITRFDGYLALFTPAEDGTGEVWKQLLIRDDVGILREIGERTPVKYSLEEIAARLWGNESE
jgi:hypothetical protein